MPCGNAVVCAGAHGTQLIVSARYTATDKPNRAKENFIANILVSERLERTAHFRTYIELESIVKDRFVSYCFDVAILA